MGKGKIIKNASIIDPEKCEQFSGSVLIENDCIKEIIRGTCIPNSVDGFEIYDAQGHVLVPGIIDVHAHTDGYYFCGENDL